MPRVLIVLLACLAACGTVRERRHLRGAAPRPAAVRSDGARTRNVIVVTVDGVRWQEIFEGVDPELAGRRGLPVVPARALMPALYARVVDRGVALGAPGVGAPVEASGPVFVSLPGYREIFSGRLPRCIDNHCPTIRRPTVVDELRRDTAAGELAVIASWETLARAAAADPTGVTISTGRHGGATRDRLRADDAAAALLDHGAAAAAAPGHWDYRPDRFTAPLALAWLEATRPRFLFVGLGDPDEHAHAGNYAGYLTALREADAFIAALFDRLDAMGEYGRETTVIVTADHGRARSFSSHGIQRESGRVWLLAVGGAVPARGIQPALETRRLCDIVPTVRELLGLPPDLADDAGDPIPELLPPEPRVAGL